MTSIFSDMTPTNDDIISWTDLIEKGDGYLTPEQNQAFEKALQLISDQLTRKLSSKFGDDPVDFEQLEDLFMNNSTGSDLEQDASAAAFQILNQLSDQIAAELTADDYA